MHLPVVTFIAAFAGLSFALPGVSPRANILQPRAYLCMQQRQATVADAIHCTNFIKDLGERECMAVEQYPNCLCWSGTVYISARAASYKRVLSTCDKVAQGLFKLIEDCKTSDGLVAGQSYAEGNGDYLIQVDGVLNKNPTDSGPTAKNADGKEDDLSRPLGFVPETLHDD